MEKLMGSWKRFSLSECEGDKFAVQEENTVEEHILAVKFLTRRVLNMEAIARTFTLLWKTRKGFEIRDMGDHKILFVFPEEADIDRVLEGEPWSFDRHLVVLQRVDRDAAIRSLDFSVTRFWIQVHDLPVGSFSLELAKKIGLVAGKVENQMTDEGDQYGVNFFRLREAVDIQKPLCRGRTIITARGKEGWVNFRYERLPNICYWCGKLTHGDRECPLWIRSRGTLKAGDQQFGAWLRATTPNPFKKTVIRVPSLDEEDGWNDFEMHGEKDAVESSPKEVGGSGSSQEAEQSREETDNQVGQVADREAELDSSDPRETSLESPNIAEPVSLRSKEVTVQKSLFQEQLEEIDYEISKFDNIKVNEVNDDHNEVTLHQQEAENKLSNGPGLLGRSSSPGVVQDKGKNKEKGWVRRERSQVRPTEHHSSILSKRTSKDVNAETEETEGHKKKVAKSDLTLSVEASSQPRRNQ
ncbi:uncharacterized protein LOC115969588 [Quercus lobata]|uniref:uncharacterized protein LOC115969588 n=1 Tax=Quercus lobata TaxID=97700 RepID=UPI0012467F66|nr:uncharacterized protein LOC115969588 [Quercus lobata]